MAKGAKRKRRPVSVVEERLPHYPGLPLRRFARGRDAPYGRPDALLWGIVFACAALCLIALVVWMIL